VGTDVAAAVWSDAYVYADQHISELMAIGAKTRPYVVPAHGRGKMRTVVRRLARQHVRTDPVAAE
jgi:hypothetical protein